MALTTSLPKGTHAAGFITTTSTAKHSKGERADDLAVGEEEPLTTLLDNPTMRKYGAIPAVDDEGMLLGVVTPGRIRRVLRETVAPVHQTPM